MTDLIDPRRLIGIAWLLLTGPAWCQTEVPTYENRAAVKEFANQIAQKNGLDEALVLEQLAQARYAFGAAKFIMPPKAGLAKNWSAYRARFVEPIRLRLGVEFWRHNAKWLILAEKTYGVPAEVVIGIIGVETIYGRQKGNFRTLDALTTLAFDFPSGRSDRSAFFKAELEQLFVLSAKQQLNPSDFSGSYAGAMGLGQFMPSSWNRYGVDFDQDGRTDLNNNADVIGGVANYLAQSGWQRDVPAFFAVDAPVQSSDRATLLVPDIKPTFKAQEFEERGAVLEQAAKDYAGLLAFIELQNGSAAATYVAGTGNFYAVTRYNWSSYYAMAVLELGKTVGHIYHKTEGQ
jgi:membrane-bound lytic murein transglycosylase B